MTDKYEPWKLDYTPWKTESAFYSWLRGGFRKGVWNQHPVKLEFIKQNRVKAPIGVLGKEVWALECEVCKEIKRQNECQVDHRHAAGSLKSKEDIEKFVVRLSFVTFDDLQIACKECHSIITHSEKKGISFDEARIEKAVIATQKEKLDSEVILKFFNTAPESSAPKRKKQLKDLLMTKDIVDDIINYISEK